MHLEWSKAVSLSCENKSFYTPYVIFTCILCNLTQSAYGKKFIIWDAFLPETTWKHFKVSCKTHNLCMLKQKIFVSESLWVIHNNYDSNIVQETIVTMIFISELLSVHYLKNTILSPCWQLPVGKLLVQSGQNVNHNCFVRQSFWRFYTYF